MKHFVEKSIRKIIRSHMTKKQRERMDNGETFVVHIHRYGKELKRWGWDNNNAHFYITGRSAKISYNSLKDLAWSNNEEEAKKEATNAISYFFYGNPNEYEMCVCGVTECTNEESEKEALFRILFDE